MSPATFTLKGWRRRARRAGVEPPPRRPDTRALAALLLAAETVPLYVPGQRAVTFARALGCSRRTARRVLNYCRRSEASTRFYGRSP